MAIGSGLVRLRGRLRELVGDAPADGSFCNAPAASMYLDQRGDVRACCQNAGFPLGNVASASLVDIWRGERADRLRRAIAADDLSLGCNFCRWQVEDGNDDAVFARTFDHLHGSDDEPAWPRQLELSISNACNLQCVMCNGEWSSSIRTHREGLPPLPKVYGDAFFDDLEQFLPHLEVVKFLGGEPFLGAEPLRVMEMLAASAPHVQVHVTTNGTQWTPRIERILDRLDVNVVVSLDGVHADTYEAIRVGSSFASVLDHVERFAAYCAERGTSFSLSHCLMTPNWHQFDDFCDLAERLGCPIYVNTVTEPFDLSLYHLRPAQLRAVVDELTSRDAAVRGRLSGRRVEVWSDQLGRLRSHLESLERHDPPAYVAKRRRLGFAWLAPPDRAIAAATELDRAVGAGTGWVLDLDERGEVVEASGVGAPSAALDEAVQELRSSGVDHVLVADPSVPDDGSVVPDDLHTYRLELAPAAGGSLDLAVTRVAVRDDDGVLVGARVFLDEHDAQRAAAALARDPADVVGLALDDDGVVAEVLGRRDALGVDVGELEGRPVAELAALVGRSGLRPEGALEDLGVTSRVRHQRQRLIGADGARCAIHAFSEESVPGSALWLVRSDAEAVGG